MTSVVNAGLGVNPIKPFHDLIPLKRVNAAGNLYNICSFFQRRNHKLGSRKIDPNFYRIDAELKNLKIWTFLAS